MFGRTPQQATRMIRPSSKHRCSEQPPKTPAGNILNDFPNQLNILEEAVNMLMLPSIPDLSLRYIENDVLLIIKMKITLTTIMINSIKKSDHKTKARKGHEPSSFLRRLTPFIGAAIALVFIVSSCVEDEGGEIPEFLDLATQVSSLDFEPVAVGETSIESYGLYGSKLQGDVTITATAPFQVSKSATDGFGTEINISPEEFTNDMTSVFVRFGESVEGEFTGEVTHTSSGIIIEPKVSLTAVSVLDPASLPNLLFRENFSYDTEMLPSTNRAADGTNPTLDGWLKVRAANKDIELADESLTFTGYPESGIGKAAIVDRNPDVPGGNANLLQHNIDPQQTSDFVGSYYVSYLFEAEAIPTVAGGFNSPVILASWNPANGASWWTSGLLVQNTKAADADPDNMVFGIRQENRMELSDKAMEVDKTYLVVLEHTVTEAIPAEQGGTTTATISIFIFEEGETIDMENEPAPVYTMENASDNYYIRSVTLFQENDVNGRYIIDGLRVTNTWEDIFK